MIEELKSTASRCIIPQWNFNLEQNGNVFIYLSEFYPAYLQCGTMYVQNSSCVAICQVAK